MEVVFEKKLLKKNFKGEVITVDSSIEMLKIAKNLLKDKLNIHFKLLDINDLFLSKKDNFDCVVAINIMFLLKDVKRFLSNVKEILKNKGYLIVVNPTPEGKITKFLKDYLRYYLFKISKGELFELFLNIKHIINVIMAQKKSTIYIKKALFITRRKKKFKNY